MVDCPPHKTQRPGPRLHRFVTRLVFRVNKSTISLQINCWIRMDENYGDRYFRWNKFFKYVAGNSLRIRLTRFLSVRMTKIWCMNLWIIKVCNVWWRLAVRPIRIIRTIFCEVNTWVRESQHGPIILAALGQLMLYVDGMNAVMNQNEVVQWLYSLVESSVRRFLQTYRTHLFGFLILVSFGGENKFKIIDCFRRIHRNEFFAHSFRRHSSRSSSETFVVVECDENSQRNG